MTIPHQRIGRGRLVPSSHKGSKFRYTIVRQISRGDERNREDIPVPDSLGKETFLVGIFTSSGNLDEHRLLSEKQHAFRKQHSCETQLITVIDDWAKILANQGQVDTFSRIVYW